MLPKLQSLNFRFDFLEKNLIDLLLHHLLGAISHTSTMNRLGLLTPAELTPAQAEAYDVMHEYTSTSYGDKWLYPHDDTDGTISDDARPRFVYMDASKRLVGPFGVQIHHPEVAKAFIGFARALQTIPDFPREVRECAILAVGSRLDAGYES